MKKRSARFYTMLFGDLAELCQKIHDLWYVQRNPRGAKRYRGRLQELLAAVPEDDISIIRQDALAWLYQLSDETSAAIKHRRHEIKAMEQLHDHVRAAVKSGRYDKGTAAFALQDRDSACLEERKAMLKTLMEEQKRNGALAGKLPRRKKASAHGK
jgi:erythromycin esterase-like protein